MATGARVLVVGAGGREHALGLALSRSPRVSALSYAGGENAGLDALATRMSLEDGENDAEAYDLVVVGPEAPLVDGLADRVRARGVPVFGPSQAAAELEASKAFTKGICAQANIPTGAAFVADNEADALGALAELPEPPVVKADGLAAGKGVIVANTHAEAEEAVRAIFGGVFGKAGARVLLEERLLGREVSLFALSDGTTVIPFGTARDYKRAFDGDTGPNTGGMGAVSPAPDLPEGLVDDAMARIVRPAVTALAARGTPYIGVLYAGLILTDTGPTLIEFNVRFGDPECQVLLPRFGGDIYELLHATATGRLGEMDPTFRPGSCVGVTVSAQAYPAGSSQGEAIGGLRDVEAAGATVLHAGTRRDGERVLANGGRVLTVVANGDSAQDARQTVYRALTHLDWPGGRYRADIGL